MISEDGIGEPAKVCSDAAPMSEAGNNFVYLPKLKIPTGSEIVERDAVLSLCAHTDYASRLYACCAPA